MKAPNPKKAYGDKKPALHLLPLSGMIEQSLAHMDGDYKYGFENWNDDPVETLTYIGAAIRHIGLYKYGERRTRDTNIHNLGAVMACCAILIDAELNGNLIDNTKHSKATCDLLHNAEFIVEQLKDMQKARDEAKLKASNPAYIVEQGLKAATFEQLKPNTVAEGLCTKCPDSRLCNRMGECLHLEPTHPPAVIDCGNCPYIGGCADRCKEIE